MTRRANSPRSTTPVSTGDKQQLADLATLLGLMQSASRISQELDAMANQVGGSLEKIAERFGVPFFEVHNSYVEQINKSRPKGKKVARARKRRVTS